jgi:hypothetical protein
MKSFEMKSFVALLLTLVLVAAQPAARARAAQGDKETPRLSPDEEKEAEAFAADFEKRLSETNDIGPLIEEMFVADFAARLGESGASSDFMMVPVGDDVKKHLSRDDRLRAYVASMNFFFLMGRLYVVAAGAMVRDGRCKVDEEDGGDGCEPPPLSEVLSRPVLEVLDKNPLLEGLAAQLAKEESAGDGGSDARGEYRERRVEKVEQFRALVATMEEADEKMRERLKDSPSPTSARGLVAQVRARRAKAGEDSGKEEEDERPRLTVLKSEFFGYPEGTRIICVSSVLPFHIDLVRDGDRLKVAALYLDDD